MDPENYNYTLGDGPDLIDAVRRWYARRYGVPLEAGEIMSVYGSQEGIAHIALAVCNPGDLVLVPLPCYPIFQIGPNLSGAQTAYYDLLPEACYLPDLDGISPELRRRARMMIVSYPANPVCAVAPKDFYHKLVAFGRDNDILIVHDNAYSEILFDGAEGISFLSVPGAKEVGVEFNSLSKTYNLTGLRISFLLGNIELIRRFRALRSQIDYGTCNLIQKAAIAALNGPQNGVAEQRAEYQRRRDALCGGLRAVGWPVPDALGTMFVWARLPAGHEDSDAFSMALLEKTGVICTPGSSFGPLGKRAVRFALVQPVPALKQAVARIAESGLLHVPEKISL
jgi:LL-diaminopimelate aminotransferase